MSRECRGKIHGHNFVGGVCLNGCGTRQAELGRRRPPKKAKPIEARIPEPVQGMHSASHAAAKEISEWCGEPRRFGMYLGVIRRIGTGRAFEIMSQMKQTRNPIKKRGPYFMACARSRTKKPPG